MKTTIGLFEFMTLTRDDNGRTLIYETPVQKTWPEDNSDIEDVLICQGDWD